MEHQTLISDTAYEIVGGTTLIGGTAYRIIGGKTLIGGTGYDISLKNQFEDNEWGDIIQACREGAIPDTWLVGDQKAMTIGGTEYLIDIIGKNHDTYSDGGTAPLTFQLHDIWPEKSIMTETGYIANWGSSYMRNEVLPEILGKMPQNVQNAIRLVTKHIIGKTSLDTVNDRLFLLSSKEVTGEDYRNLSEGERYEYYQSKENRIKYLSGSANSWFTRTPVFELGEQVCMYWCITTKGNRQHLSGNLADGISFAFCF